jgi:hypothetical protein
MNLVQGPLSEKRFTFQGHYEKEGKREGPRQPRTIALCAKGAHNADEFKAILEASVQDLLAGKISTRIATKVSGTIGNMLRAVEQNDQNRLRELSEDLKKLALSFEGGTKLS